MPELPEVEVTKRTLEKRILSKKIIKVQINNVNLRYKVNPKLKNLEGLFIRKIVRRSKFLLLFLNKDFVLLVHLGMTGKFLIEKNYKSLSSKYYHSDVLRSKHNHIKFLFSDKTLLIYNDVRRFGFFILENLKNINNNRFLKNLGPEPFSKKLTVNIIKNRIKESSRNIKSFLMDQKFIAGIGNIYASEILFKSKIHPTTIAKSISSVQIKKLIKSIKEVLYSAIKDGGSTIRDFMFSEYSKGNFQNKFNVYDRHGLECYICKNKIQKLVINLRSTYFCSNCQRKN